MIRASLAVVLAIVAAAAVSCGGDDTAATQYEGQAGVAVTQYFRQENAGGVLPEGVGAAGVGGVTKDDLHLLGVSDDWKDDGVKARFCVEFDYQKPPDAQKTRVYIAERFDEGWGVQAVKPDGTCEGVT